MMSIIQVGNVLLSSDIITECFCCDLDACKGICCIEGDAGAPVLFEEIAPLEEVTEIAWSELSAQAQAQIDKQGVVYTDRDGDLVTSIVNNKDCVFTCYENGVPSSVCIEKARPRFANPYHVACIPFEKSVSVTTL